jgi:hypothetical protein
LPYILASCRAKSRHPVARSSGNSAGFLGSARNDRNCYFFTASAFGALCCA